MKKYYTAPEAETIGMLADATVAADDISGRENETELEF